MNDYFDALEHELKAAVPRAARSHRRGRTLARLPLFRLGSLLLLIALALAPALALTGGFTHTGGHRQPATRQAHQKRHGRTPRQPNEMTLLKGLIALRRRADLTSIQARSVQNKMRWTASAPLTSLLRFAADTAAVGIQSVLISTRRRIKDPPQTTATGILQLTLADPRRCGARQHAPTTPALQVSATASRAGACGPTTSSQHAPTLAAQTYQAVRRPTPDATLRSTTAAIQHSSKPATCSTRRVTMERTSCQRPSRQAGPPFIGTWPIIHAAADVRTPHQPRHTSTA